MSQAASQMSIDHGAPAMIHLAAITCRHLLGIPSSWLPLSVSNPVSELNVGMQVGQHDGMA